MFIYSNRQSLPICTDPPGRAAADSLGSKRKRGGGEVWGRGETSPFQGAEL